jgi:hypothetical protein
MGRRTIYLPPSVEALVEEMSRRRESFSAAVARLVEAGARAQHGPRRPSWVGSGEGPEDLGRRADRYLRQLVKSG